MTTDASSDVRFSNPLRFAYLIFVPFLGLGGLLLARASPLWVPVVGAVCLLTVFRIVRAGLYLERDRLVDRRVLSTRTFLYVDIEAVEMVEWKAWSTYGNLSDGRQLRLRTRSGQRHALGGTGTGQDAASDSSDRRLDEFKTRLEQRIL